VAVGRLLLSKEPGRSPSTDARTGGRAARNPSTGNCQTVAPVLLSVMAIGDRELGLRGRRAQCQELDRLVASARSGESKVLVLRGDAGVGKTALLDYLADSASGCRIARVAGDESEMELAFAGLQQFCAPMLDHLDRIPVPQRVALSTAFGLSAGEPPDRFLVGLAVLSLLAEVADSQPLVCLIDDIHWLDRVSAQTFAFVGRRLLAESVALVFAERSEAEEQDLRGLPELPIKGLGDADSRWLLKSALHGPLDAAVCDRIVAETRGNPLALLELPRGLTSAELAGGFGLPDTVPLANRIEEEFIRRLDPLPADTRRLLLAAAVEPVGDVTLLWRAAQVLGIGIDAAVAAEASGLVEIGARVRFRHPLVRSAACRSAGKGELHTVHRALAEVTDPDLDPDRRAWHRARAAVGPDEEVAVDLLRSAHRAEARGGLAAAAAFLEEATRLTLDPVRRAQRALGAAHAKYLAGAPEAALGLLAVAESGPFDELQGAKMDLLRAQIAYVYRPGSEAPPLLLKAAKRLEGLDITLARETYLDAFTAAVIVGRLSRGADMAEVATAVRLAPAPSSPPLACDHLLDGLALVHTDGRGAGTPLLKRALSAFRNKETSAEGELRWLWIAGRVAQDLWDDEAWYALCTRHVHLARQMGGLAVLPIALRSRIFVHCLAGELDEGAALTEEVKGVTDATGTELAAYGAVALSAWRGDEAEALRLIGSTIADVSSRGEGMGVGIGQFLTALLYNGLGRYAEALAAAKVACEYDDMGVLSWALTETIEAAARSDQHEVGVAALERLSESTQAGGSDWALGIEARSRALLSQDDIAERLYREAIDRLSRTRVLIELARTHLLYGEWLRRIGRRVDAREQLRTAYEMLSRMGANGFAERARRELLATGETVRKRTDDTRDDLTAQEEQIARLASEGRTNPEIGAELFISSRTVEWHLRKVYPKLGITSRKQLQGALLDARGPSGVPVSTGL
jgi:DNA-binding CsgD family transcriptional regulator